MKPARRAFVLLLVLIVIAFLSLGAYSFTDYMLAQHDAAIQYGRQAAARGFTETGANAVVMVLALPEQQRTDAGGIFDNTERFQGVTVIDDLDPAARGCFTVLAPNLDSSGNLSGVRYGLEDESTRLNLNALLAIDKLMPGSGQTFLMALPGMTEDVADAILDWLDTDEEPRELGAEIEYYSGLSPPYAPKNGPMETVEELLLVRGVTPALLFGADANRNGQLDPHESAGVDADPAAFRGWSAYLTLHSLEWNVTPEGQPRIYLNNSDLKALHEQLLAVFPAEWADFIIAYRQMGPNTSTSNTTVSIGSAPELNLELPAKQNLVQVLDLVGATVRYTQSGTTNVAIMESPFDAGLGEMAAYMPQLMDYVTINPAEKIPGRININQASATVLAGIPGMSPEIAEQIVSAREADASAEEARRHETWILQEAIVTLEEMRALMPFVTCGGDVYRAQVVGYFQGSAASSRAEVIFDATTPLPRILFWRDISHLGRGYAVETLGVDFTE